MKCKICDRKYSNWEKHVYEFHGDKFARIHDAVITGFEEAINGAKNSVKIMEDSTTGKCDHDPMIMPLEGTYACPR